MLSIPSAAHDGGLFPTRPRGASFDTRSSDEQVKIMNGSVDISLEEINNMDRQNLRISLFKALHFVAEAKKQLEIMEERYRKERSRRVSLEYNLALSSSRRSMGSPSPPLSDSSRGKGRNLSNSSSSSASQALGEKRSSVSSNDSGSNGATSGGRLIGAIDKYKDLQRTYTPRSIVIPEQLTPRGRSDMFSPSSPNANRETQILELVDCLEQERALHRKREEVLENQLQAALSSKEGGATNAAHSKGFLDEIREAHAKRTALMERELATLRGRFATGMYSPRRQQSSTATATTAETGKSTVVTTVTTPSKFEPASPTTPAGSSIKQEEKYVASVEDLKATLKQFSSFEESFAKTMDAISDCFVTPMTKQSFDTTTQETVSGGINLVSAIISFYKKFRTKLKKCTRRSGTGIGELLSEIIGFVPSFESYAHNYERYILVINELTKNPAVCALLEKALIKATGGGKILEELLFAPIEHVAQYSKQLTMLRDSTPPNHAEAASIQKALSDFEGMDAKLQKLLRDAQGVLQTVLIGKRLPEATLLIQANRRALGEFSASVVDERHKLHKRYFFLFNDLLIETRPRSNGPAVPLSPTASPLTPSAPAAPASAMNPALTGPTSAPTAPTSFKILNYHSLIGAGVADVSEGSSPSHHWIVIDSPEVHLTLAFDSELDKQGWLVKLKEAMPEVLKNIRSTSTRLLRTHTSSMDKTSEKHRPKRSETFSGISAEEPRQKVHHEKSHRKHH